MRRTRLLEDVEAFFSGGNSQELPLAADIEAEPARD
jgi:hypothetical protein